MEPVLYEVVYTIFFNDRELKSNLHARRSVSPQHSDLLCAHTYPTLYLGMCSHRIERRAGD